MKQSVICIAGASGGTGKSTLAKEVSVAFSGHLKTCLIDLDLSHAAQNALFKITPKKNIMDWVWDYQQSKITLSLEELRERYTWDFIQEFMVVPQLNQMYILPAPGDGAVHELEREALEMMLLQLREYFDVIILDTGNNLDSATQSAMICADRILLVTTADHTAIADAKKMRRYIRLKDWDIGKYAVVINRQPPSRKALYSADEIEDILYIPVIGVLNEDKNLWMLNNAGIPAVKGDDSPLKKAIQKLQYTLTG
ncbi:MinD/ParA family protein (plasmid) [Enterocloster clostridioformis]